MSHRRPDDYNDIEESVPLMTDAHREDHGGDPPALPPRSYEPSSTTSELELPTPATAADSQAPLRPHGDDNGEDIDATGPGTAGAGVAGGTGTGTGTRGASDASIHSRLGDHDPDNALPAPWFLDDDSPSWKRWRWVPYPLRRVTRWVVRWTLGPRPPIRYRINPFFPTIQQYPLRLAERLVPNPTHRTLATLSLFFLWWIIFAIVKSREGLRTETVGWGLPDDISCSATYWSAANSCGINGTDCRPFVDAGFAFRCPAGCQSQEVLEPRAVGAQEVNYQPLVIGGPPADAGDDSADVAAAAFYRGDSYICAAAMHAGIVSNSNGGCGVVRLIGTRANYPASDRHGISSVGFDSYFPQTFAFDPVGNCGAADNRWGLFGLSAVCMTLLALFTADPAHFFFPVFVIAFWQVGMATDPPSHTSVADQVSTVLGRFLPGAFGAWVIFDCMGVRRTLKGLTAQVEKVILWLGALWVGILDNYTISAVLPIQRLNGHDLEQQPGAMTALGIIIALLVVITLTQIWFFRQEGRLVSLLGFLGLLLVGVVVSLNLPGLSLRLHHYIFALALLPATSIQMRPSLVYQGLLVGLFINGISRWGFDSVLQTPDALRGDAQLNSALPVVLEPIVTLGANVSTIGFAWEPPPASGLYDGVSVLVNDVERFRGYYDDDADGTAGISNAVAAAAAAATAAGGFEWTRSADLGMNEYFRFGYMSGSERMDFTRAGIWTADGDWVTMEPGPSKVKTRRGPEESSEEMRLLLPKRVR